MATDPKRAKEIFLEAVELPDAAARAAYLDRACGGDTGLRGRVEALLRSHNPDSNFLGTPAAVVPGPDPTATLTISDDSNPDSNRTDETLAFLARPGRPGSLGRID